MRKLAFLFVCVAVLALLGACGGEETATEKAVAPAVDNEFFSIKLAAGWQAGPLTSGMVNVLPKGKTSPGLYFKFEGHGNAVGTAEASIQSMIKGYNGSPMEDIEIAGTLFKATTYTYGGSTQTMYVAFREGTKVTITIEGKDGKDNPDIQAMIDSLVLK